ncbi:rhodopsin, GQ-coupled-like [Epargyreus clarus]|uniref:rhodopsin, GQ-coupled-like n=1 Tax=Epargyreus clarus TaxID=520877 RepID=UPI003C2F5A2A
MAIQDCVWSDLFDDQARNTLQRGFVITGTISVILSGWLTLTIFFTNLRFNLSYRNLACFTAVACVRRAMPMLSYLLFANYNDSWHDMQTFSCEFFAFWETFLAVYEVESLTHVCIERYVVAKYITKGWVIPKRHYLMFQCLCLLLAGLYSFPPVFGLGRYGPDFACTSCTFDMTLPDTWQRYFIISIFLLRSVKPALFMIMMLMWTRNLEDNFTSSVKTIKHLRFTQSVIAVTFMNLACWSPIAVLRGWVVLLFALYNDVQIESHAYVQWAMWLHWVSPAVTAVSVFLIDDTIRHKMINMHSDDIETDEEEKKNE